VGGEREGHANLQRRDSEGGEKDKRKVLRQTPLQVGCLAKRPKGNGAREANSKGEMV